MVPLAVRALSSKQAPLRQMASRFLAAMCVVEPLQSMEVVIRRVVPLLGDASQPQRRLGATEALYKIVLAMDLQVCALLARLPAARNRTRRRWTCRRRRCQSPINLARGLSTPYVNLACQVRCSSGRGLTCRRRRCQAPWPLTPHTLLATSPGRWRGGPPSSPAMSPTPLTLNPKRATQVLPYAVFLVVPILGRMSDAHAAVRQTITKTFARVLQLLPLEASIPDPEGLSADLAAKKTDERRFLEQLLDTSKIDNLQIPVRVGADLRRYQQEGVNWMGFMLKYNLHGVLADDMGLGKTLQSICILATDHHNRRADFAARQSPGSAPLPSLVVCPPTLVGHWHHEIAKFLPDETLVSVPYVGAPAERKALRQRVLGGGDCVVITSYDTLRNDVDFLGGLAWNYCILDEGHVIRNGKSKTTQAVKLVRANHRLLLSGTPIQNNALELWSLFDFLMPGFLGSEQSFNDMYSKPILASRNAKCSSREAEAGALALEALHRQVHTVLCLLLAPCVTGLALLLSHRPHPLLYLSVSSLL